MIAIPASLLNEVHQHTESSYPHECCGLLIGVSENDTRTVHAFRKCRNLNTERAHDRYELDPQCQLQAQREFRNTPWDIIGIYHSHPDHPSRPSQTDTDRAFPGYSYVIISVEKGTVASARSWVLNESGAERHFDQEELVRVDEVTGGKS